MKRRLFNLASALSLFLCLATAVLWVRSYFRADTYLGHAGHWTVIAMSNRGRLSLSCARANLPNFPHQTPAPSGYRKRAAHAETAISGDPGARHQAGAFGFSWYVSDGGMVVRRTPMGHTIRTFFAAHRDGSVPHWFPILLFGTLPSSWLLRWLRRRRRRRWTEANRCSRCGYDLRATTGRCPECGTPVPVNTEATA